MALPALEVLTAKLAAFVDDDPTDEQVVDAAQEALDLVTGHVGTRAASIPDGVGRRACVEVGADLYHRRAAKNGIVGINSMDVSPVRVARDPMTAAYALLAPYVGRGIA